MGYNIVSNIKNCSDNIDFLMNGNANLLYYSHIPAIIVSFLMGFYVLLKGKRDIVAKVFFAFSISFALYTLLNLIAWMSFSSTTIMFTWSLLGIFWTLTFIFSLYFTYVFIDKKDISFGKKIVFGILILPIIIFTPTVFNLSGFDFDSCSAVDKLFLNYTYVPQAAVAIWIIILSIRRFIKADKQARKQIILVALGISFFLLTFFGVSYIADTYGIYSLEIYAPLTQVIFLGLLAYLIVKFKVFNIKLLAAQALVFALVILIGSMFFFVQGTTSMVLVGITLAISVSFGYMLVKSIRLEVERKEQLQMMADKLAIANDQLRKLDNAKTEFISIASHQLRTPITAIKGFASLLLEGSYGEISDSVHGAVEKVYVSSERLVNLIEDLLNVSRIESGRMTFAFENNKVEKLLKELCENFMLIAKNKKLYLDLKLPEIGMPEIKMDYSKIRELVSNFIDNALKYTEKGGVTIKADVRDDGVVIDDKGFVIEKQKSPYGKVIRITVSDTGIGVPKEEIPYLFRKFSRGKDVSRLSVGGTGLGLYVGKAIAEAHHGQTWLESEGTGMGSRFIIEIPINSGI